MEAKLAKDEVIIKEWDYSTAGHRFSKNKVHKILTVTNKRLIAAEEGKYDLVHNEIPLKNVVSIEGNYKKNDSIWVKIKFVLSIILCFTIIYMFFGGLHKTMNLYYQIKSCILDLSVSTDSRYGQSLSIGRNQGEGGVAKQFHLFGNSINRKITYVDKEVARVILSELGAVILENKEVA